MVSFIVFPGGPGLLEKLVECEPDQDAEEIAGKVEQGEIPVGYPYLKDLENEGNKEDQGKEIDSGWLVRENGEQHECEYDIITAVLEHIEFPAVFDPQDPIHMKIREQTEEAGDDKYHENQNESAFCRSWFFE